jgi:hypothetical protein
LEIESVTDHDVGNPEYRSEYPGDRSDREDLSDDEPARSMPPERGRQLPEESQPVPVKPYEVRGTVLTERLNDCGVVPRNATATWREIRAD